MEATLIPMLRKLPLWAADAVMAASELNIINGRSSNRFASSELATRAEAVVMLLNTIEAGK